MHKFSERRAPTTITSPSTSSALAKIEPRIEVCATTVSPARSAKITTNSSGRLPSVDCSSPVTPGPKRSPTCSVANETTQARPASATVASAKASSGAAPAYFAMPAAAVAAATRARKIRSRAVRPAMGRSFPLPSRPMLPEWPRGTVAILVTAGDEPHAIPVSAALRAGPSRALLGLAARRASLARLRADPRAALVVLAAGDVALTAHGRAAVLDELVEGVVAVRLDIERVQEHGQPTFVIDDGVQWHWTDAEAVRRDSGVHDALRALAATLAAP